jgi:hypothetical protein
VTKDWLKHHGRAAAVTILKVSPESDTRGARS